MAMRKEFGRTSEAGELFIIEMLHSSEVRRLVLVCLVAEVLQHLLQVDFDLVESLD